MARFYIHAGVVLIAALISVAVTNTHYSLVLMFGLPGLFLLFTGLVCFFRFLQRHPKSESAHANP
ncbi:hypothetical protein JXD38_02285 [candidate division WOR-3 bacterium]|nr:hypothetical protein [candidate division WOR-3 bacterium]